MATLLTPSRRRGVEYLDEPGVDPAIVRRSLGDVTVANTLFGGTRAVMRELAPLFRGERAARRMTLLDVGTGLGDIPDRARALAERSGVSLETYGVDIAQPVVEAVRGRVSAAVRATALALPMADHSVDIVTCSQTLHHFDEAEARVVVRELDRVARVRAVVADLRRDWVAVAGIWLASFPLGFHPVSRHDGVVSVLRGFTAGELAALVGSAVRDRPRVRRHLGFRVTASWRPAGVA